MPRPSPSATSSTTTTPTTTASGNTNATPAYNNTDNADDDASANDASSHITDDGDCRGRATNTDKGGTGIAITACRRGDNNVHSNHLYNDTHNAAASDGGVGGGDGINPRGVISRAIRLIGISVGSCAMFHEMNRAIGLHRLRPAVDEVFPFERAADAYAKLRSGGHFGKLVISI